MSQSVYIELDKKRRLSYGLNAMCALEDAGVKLVTTKDLERPRVFRAVLWAGLLEEEPTLTPEQVGAMVPLNRMREVGVAMAKALEQALPEPEQKAASKRPRKAQR